MRSMSAGGWRGRQHEWRGQVWHWARWSGWLRGNMKRRERAVAASSNAPSHAPGRGKGLGESQEGGRQDRGDSSHGPHYKRPSVRAQTPSLSARTRWLRSYPQGLIYCRGRRRVVNARNHSVVATLAGGRGEQFRPFWFTVFEQRLLEFAATASLELQSLGSTYLNRTKLGDFVPVAVCPVSFGSDEKNCLLVMELRAQGGANCIGCARTRLIFWTMRRNSRWLARQPPA